MWAPKEKRKYCPNLGLLKLVVTLTSGKKVKMLVAQLVPTLCNPMHYSHQAPLSMEFSRQEYWSG